MLANQITGDKFDPKDGPQDHGVCGEALEERNSDSSADELEGADGDGQ